MKIIIDTHTHTISSGHSYSTIQEMARGAADKGLAAIAMTDHGPSMEGAPHIFHFGNLRVVPREIYGVRIFKGVEANIIDMDGNVDLPERILSRLEFVIASFHDICVKPGSVEENTSALVKVIQNPLIDAIGHPGNPQFPVDIDRVVKMAREYGKMIEINNHSFRVRLGSEKNCREYAKKCREYGTTMVCGSDAHISFDVGSFDNIYKIFEETGVTEELVLNTSLERFETYLENKRKRIGEAYIGLQAAGTRP